MESSKFKIGQRVIGLDVDHSGGFSEEIAIQAKVIILGMFHVSNTRISYPCFSSVICIIDTKWIFLNIPMLGRLGS